MLFVRDSEKINPGMGQRIVLKESNLPGKQIYGFSHTSIPMSPRNTHYGENPDFYNCWMVSDIERKKLCKQNKDKIIWFTELRLSPPGENRIYARLTFNPYFEEMMTSAYDVIND
ncbi:MAG: DUF4127 family protein [Proteobacteria bacterium]|nr:DUF4127 family protein [Pseudomonadota bacterium]